SSSGDESTKSENSQQQRNRGPGRLEGLCGDISDAADGRLSISEPESWQSERIRATTAERRCVAGGCRWDPEPNVGRVAHGISARVDRLKGLGNAIVPQVAYEILRVIKKYQNVSKKV